MLEHIKRSKFEIAVLSFWIIFLNSYRIFSEVIGVDTEQSLMAFDTHVNWTMGLGRFVSAFLMKILMPYGFSYKTAMLFIVLGWIGVCLLYHYFLEKYGNWNRWSCLVFSLAFVSCPIWSEQNYFVCTVFVNVIGMMFSIAAAHFMLQSFENKLNWKKVWTAALFIVLAVGIYQALLYLVVANCIIFLTVNAYTKKKRFAEYLRQGIGCIGLLAVSVILYFIVSRIMSALLYDSATDYVGFTDAASYITGRIRWFQDGIAG